MGTGSSESVSSPVPLSIYGRLRHAEPPERVEIVLRLIEEHPNGRLELGARDGLHAVLKEVNLSRAAVRVRWREVTGSPHWWDAERQAPCFRGADLLGASLSLANLQGVVLEQAQLQGADLAGANLRNAVLAEANLDCAMLEETDLRGAGLRFANLHRALLEGANLRGADLWGANLSGAVLSEADLRDACLIETSLQEADLTGASLRGASLTKANLQRARLHGADLRRATLTGANLEGCELKDARLEGVVLTHSDIKHVHLSGAWLQKTRLRQEQLGGAIGEELACEYEEARKGYLSLERNFAELGDPDAASWAYRRKRRMQKLDALRQSREALGKQAWRESIASYSRFSADQFVEWLCDYGESIPRVLRSMLALYLLFIVIYGVTGSVVRVSETPGGMVRAVTRRPIDLAIFSLMAMSTSGTPTVGLQPSNEFVHALIAGEALLTIGLTGLLGFVIGNRIRR